MCENTNYMILLMKAQNVLINMHREPYLAPKGPNL